MSVEIPPFSESERSESKRESVTPTPPAAEESRLRGRLVEELRAKQQEDAETSSRLRGKLLEQLSSEAAPETATVEEESEPSRLRGSLLNISDHAKIETAETTETSGLRGKLLEKQGEAEAVESEVIEPYSEEWLLRQTFIQRDGGDEFVAVGFNQGTNSKLITLVSPKTKARTSHAIGRFVERLQTPGEAWSVKENSA